MFYYFEPKFIETFFREIVVVFCFSFSCFCFCFFFFGFVLFLYLYVCFFFILWSICYFCETNICFLTGIFKRYISCCFLVILCVYRHGVSFVPKFLPQNGWVQVANRHLALSHRKCYQRTFYI